MGEQRFFCNQCQWTPQSDDEQSIVCPKCGSECIKVDVVLKDEIEAWYEDSTNESEKAKNHRM
ncbi:MAG: hypothetical protein K8Q89_06230 [Nitrosarchaeum sp.]|nr:hypothetical protein [Nitrosarchaeum sp.]